MKQGKRMIGLTLIGILALSLAVPTLGFASSMKNKEHKDDAFKQGPPQWVLEKFTSVEGSKIKFNKNKIKFDTPPMIKEGRTLIPIRAITEGMGGSVTWNGTEMTVTVTHPDSDAVIVFFLKTGKVEVDGEEVTIDVKPGLHNNRTYVPLRFIAETFGLKVNHDDATGETDIENGPSLKPGKVVFEEAADIEDVDVKLVLNDFTFEGIEGLSEGDADTDEYIYDEDNATVTLSQDYIESLDAEKTVLTFKFEDSDDNQVEKTFKIMLDFNEEDSEDPTISPKKVTFDVPDEATDVVINMALNGYTLDAILEGDDALDKDDDYTVSDDTVTLDDNYLKALDEEETKLTFVFEKDGQDDVELEFEIEFESVE